MHPPADKNKKKGSSKNTPRDKYEISGKVSDKAVVVQGPNAQVEVIQRDATPAEIRQEIEAAELEILKKMVLQKIKRIKEQINLPIAKEGNPFRFGQALSLNEAHRLVGREKAITTLVQRWQSNQTVFMAGNGSSGKTSLLQAGLLPIIFQDDNLAVIIPFSSESLETNIKRQFLDKVGSTQYLSQIPLSTFLRHVTECLPKKMQLYLMIDRSEDFLRRPDAETSDFKREWEYCIANLPRVHWLFGIHTGFQYLFNYFESGTNVYSNLVVIGLLERKAAREAILRPYSNAEIDLQTEIVEDILDQIGPHDIDPGQLQTVCYILAGGNQGDMGQWDFSEYKEKGRAEGILQTSLEGIISHFRPDEREPSWRILTYLAEEHEKELHSTQLVKRMQAYGLKSEALRTLIRQLEDNHLIEVKDEKYRIASTNFLPRIEKWADEQAALQKAQLETERQVRHIRNSALRGFAGGAIGFLLFDQLIYTGPTPDLFYLILALTMTASLGGIAGFLLTLSIDLASASYRRASDWYRYFVGGIGGILAFVIVLLMYANLNYVGDALIQVLGATSLEASAWGLVIGLGITWGMKVNRPIWLVAPIIGLGSGLVLLGAEILGGALINDTWQQTSSLFRVFLAGSMMPLLYSIAALWGRKSSEGSEI